MSKNTRPDLEEFAQLVADHRKYVEILRSGGFVCFLPQLIDADCPAFAKLVGFPIAISFNALPVDLEQMAIPCVVTATYWFDHTSYRADQACRSLTYFTQPLSEFRVELVCNARKALWEGYKYRNEEVVVSASGRDLLQLVVHLTLSGVEGHEIVHAMRSCSAVASSGVYLFTPQPPFPASGRQTEPETSRRESPSFLSARRPFFSRPADRSFAAYKEFLRGMTAALGGEDNLTEEELRQSWREFWGESDETGTR